MPNITFISTVHKEIGKCNAVELCQIMEELKPEVIFLEALDNTYSVYEELAFSSFEVLHEKLEISAIQKYSTYSSFDYVPVLENGLSDSFQKKYDLISDKRKLQDLIDKFNSLATEYGFKFLNSTDASKLQTEMRLLEKELLNDGEISQRFDADIDEYESSMIQNIYSYCKRNEFNSAIFMCGVAHRKSIIEKIEKFKAQRDLDLDWTIFGE